MRYLIDANIFLFMLWEKDRLTKEVRDIIEDYNNRIYISAESVKEIINLRQCGKFTAQKRKLEENIVDYIYNEIGFEIKPIQKEHLKTLDEMPIIHNHKDPSDRMIIAQAITEKIALVSSDKMFPYYKKLGLELVFNEY